MAVYNTATLSYELTSPSRYKSLSLKRINLTSPIENIEKLNYAKNKVFLADNIFFNNCKILMPLGAKPKSVLTLHDFQESGNAIAAYSVQIKNVEVQQAEGYKPVNLVSIDLQDKSEISGWIIYAGLVEQSTEAADNMKKVKKIKGKTRSRSDVPSKEKLTDIEEDVERVLTSPNQSSKKIKAKAKCKGSFKKVLE
ncbi:MAG: hypothetical protein K9L17_14020 [Clostridiales bacterium]|nr:hypothetical protein [Clostridiales bacterium]MCF8023788.1 hypothetical protein [Clostridiales bacterium]